MDAARQADSHRPTSIACGGAAADARAAPSATRIEWLTRAADLGAIAGAWRALEASVERRTALVGYDFLAPWYRHYEGSYGGMPLVGLAWRGSTLTGVAPLTLRRGSVGRIPVARVEFAPNDSMAGEFLVADDRPETVHALLDSLVASARFDVACLDGFHADGAVLAAIAAWARTRGIGLETADQASAVVDLHAGYDVYRPPCCRPRFRSRRSC